LLFSSSCNLTLDYATTQQKLLPVHTFNSCNITRALIMIKIILYNIITLEVSKIPWMGSTTSAENYCLETYGK